MHARELVELAGLVVHHRATLIQGGPLTPVALQPYWTSSKCRFDRWGRALKGASEGAYLRGVLEEILTGEVLTRVWAALLAIHDRRHGTGDTELIGRSILLGHCEARHRALKLLVHGPGVDSHAAVALNRLRRQAERWTDLLVAKLMELADVSEFALSSARAREFAGDLADDRALGLADDTWRLLMASLRIGFRHGMSPTSPNGDLNRQIASSILGSLGPNMFDSTGLLQSAWLTRLTRTTEETEVLLSDLFAADSANSMPSEEWNARLRRPS